MPSGIYERKPKNHICHDCNSNTSHLENNSQHWYRYNDYWLCKKCYDHKRHSVYDKKIISYKYHKVLINDFARTGICSQCGKVCQTDLHHIEYHDDDVLKDTVELCKSCHISETWKSGQYYEKMRNFSLMMNRDKKTGRFIPR